jgi:hypothetical protein
VLEPALSKTKMIQVCGGARAAQHHLFCHAARHSLTGVAHTPTPWVTRHTSHVTRHTPVCDRGGAHHPAH